MMATQKDHAVKMLRDIRSEHTIYRWADQRPVHGSAAQVWLHKIARIVLICFRETGANLLSLRAGYLTYALLLSMVPMLAMSTAVVKGLGGGNQLRQLVYTYVETLTAATPDDLEQSDTETAPAGDGTEIAESGAADLATHIRSAVDKIFNYVDRTNFATLGTFGMVGMFISVIMVLGQIEKSLNVIWKVEKSRSLLRKIADYISLMILLPISINVALAAGTTLESQALSLHLDRFLPIIWMQTLLLQGVPVLFLSATLYVIYIFFPNTKTSGMATMIGALVAGSCWFITQNFYISAQIGVAKYNAIYGSFATIPLFLAWVWVAWLFVLVGAQLAYAIQNEPLYHFSNRQYEPALKLSAALDVFRTVGNRFSSDQATSYQDLVEANKEYAPELIETTVDTLVKAGVLHHSRETDELFPARPPEKMSHAQIVEAVLGTETPETPGGEQAAQALAGAANYAPEERPGPAGAEAHTP